MRAYSHCSPTYLFIDDNDDEAAPYMHITRLCIRRAQLPPEVVHPGPRGRAMRKKWKFDPPLVVSFTRVIGLLNKLLRALEK